MRSLQDFVDRLGDDRRQVETLVVRAASAVMAVGNANVATSLVSVVTAACRLNGRLRQSGPRTGARPPQSWFPLVVPGFVLNTIADSN
jgi:hypothetical protein